MAFRVDFLGTLRPPEQFTEGRVVVDGAVTRPGVFSYFDADGNEIREYRPPEEVFSDETLRSFGVVPFTDDHPAEPVDIDNARQHSVGAAGSPRVEEGWLSARIGVFDRTTLAKMEAGKTALSAGFFADIDATPGVTEGGERYDVVQRNIRANHVALVDMPRVPDAQVRMDARVFDENQIGGARQMRLDKDHTMPATVRVDGIDVQVESERDAQLVRRELERKDEAAAAAEKRVDAAEEDRDSEKERADAAEKRAKDIEDSLPALVKDRHDLVMRSALALKSDDVSALAAKTDRQLISDALETLTGDRPGDSEELKILRERFDTAMKMQQARSDSLASVARADSPERRQQSSTSPAVEAYRRMVEDSRKGPRGREEAQQ